MRRVAALIVVGLLAWFGWWEFASTPTPDPDATAREAASVLRRGNGSEPESMDPQTARTDGASNIVRDLFEGLTALGPEGDIVGAAAKSWTIDEQGLVYTFVLRDGLRWSNGDQVTAGDFAFALQRLVDPATAAPFAKSISVLENAPRILKGEMSPEKLGVEALDDRTLVLRLNAPTPYLLGLLNHNSTYPVHSGSMEALGDDWTKPGKLVSNGAYRLTGWTVGSHVTIERNPHYRDNANTAIDRIEYHHIADQIAELNRYRAGDLDLTYSVPPERIDWIKENIPDELRVAPYVGTYFYGFNTTRPPFEDNVPVRKALSMVIDRELLVEKVTRRGELPAYGWVPPGIAGHTTRGVDFEELGREARIAEARRLYREAGYGSENPLRIELRYNTGHEHKRLATAIASMWKELLGVETDLVGVEFRVHIEQARARQITQIFRASWLGDYDDASNFLLLFRSDYNLNMTGYDNPEYDALLAQAAQEPDPSRRRVLLERAEQTMLDDHPLIPIYFYVSKHLVKSRVIGWRENIIDYNWSRHLSLARVADADGTDSAR